jgi:hypothetical protein
MHEPVCLSSPELFRSSKRSKKSKYYCFGGHFLFPESARASAFFLMFWGPVFLYGIGIFLSPLSRVERSWYDLADVLACTEELCWQPFVFPGVPENEHHEQSQKEQTASLPHLTRV